MKTFLEFSDKDIYPDSPDKKRDDYRERRAARAVVSDDDGRVALLHVRKYDYYKLPGGGIDDGEAVEEALRRELREEIGCAVEVGGELGLTIEYRDRYQFKQTSYCFVAKKVGEQTDTELTAKELADQFEMIWAANLDEAIQLVAEARPELYEARHIQMRDTAILRAARPS